MFALVDCNNFYASCERVFQPLLNKQPIVVLSNNDGCIIARSNEAKALGIPMGAPAFKYKEVFIKNRIHVFSSNYALYGDMSARVMNLLAEFTPEIEVYSIDEAFLKFKGFHINHDLKEYCIQLKKRIEKGTGIPISVGIAPTKALTKVANKIAKKFSYRTQGVYWIQTDEQRIKALKWTKIEDVWGIGRQHAKRLQEIRIENAFQFSQLPDEWVRKQMSVVGLRLKKELEGISTLYLEEVQNKKAIATTRSFDHTYEDYEYIKERVSSFAIICAEKMRRQNSCCNAVMVFLKTNEFQVNKPQYRRSLIIQTPYPTNSSIDIIKCAIEALNKIFKKKVHYKKAGVILMALQPENSIQLNIFYQANPRHKVLMQKIDYLNKSIGQQKIKFACQDLNKLWKMRQERLSQRYTTKLSEILEVNI